MNRTVTLLLGIMGITAAAAAAGKEPMMGKMDIEKLDQYMRRAEINPGGLRWYDPRNGGFEVLGMHWFPAERRYHRFPQKMTGKVRPGLLQLAGCTAGGQLRFRTDSRRIVLSVRNTSDISSATMAETGRSGFDLYTGSPGEEVFWNCARPVPGKADYVSEIFCVPDRTLREFRLNFPLYNGVEELSVALEEDAQLLPPSPLPVKQPVVIYGTSITQGGCASRPGSAFTNRLSRSLQAEFLNFGFSGHGTNDPEIAELLAEIPNPAMYILDSEANSVSAELIRERVPRFLEILRKSHPETPIVIVTKVPYGPRYAAEIPSFKEEFRTIYAERLRAGDRHLYFVDGSAFWGSDYTECTVDGAHPTDLGFAQMAQKLDPILRKLLIRYNRYGKNTSK